MHAKMKLFMWYFTFAVLVSLLVSCATNYSSEGYKKRVGGVYLSVMSVTPWYECKKDLQANFKLTEAQALDNVALTSQLDESQAMNAFNAALNIGLSLPSGSSNSGSGTTSSGSSSAQGSSTSASSGSSSSSTTPANSSSTSANPSPPSRAFDLTTDMMGKAVPIDAIMKYNLAASLFQEIKMINRVVSDAAIRRNYTPYIVRLQISVLPDFDEFPKRTDVEATLSFFPKEDEESSPQKAPCIIPLLVTDDIEGALQSRSAEKLRQYALGLAAQYQGMGGKVDLQQVNDAINNILGRSINNLFTVARVQDNTIIVRLSCYQTVNKKYRVPVGNHYISVLLLAPKGGAKSFRVFLTNSLIDKEDAEKYDRTACIAAIGKSANNFLEKEAKIYGLPATDSTYGYLRSLLNYASENDWVSFSNDLKMHSEYNMYPDRNNLWQELLSIVGKLDYGETLFDLPSRYDKKLPPNQAVIALDDCKSNTCVQLIGGQGLFCPPSNPPMEAYLYLIKKGDDEKNALRIPAQIEIAEGRGGTNPKLTFPSMDKIGLKSKKEAIDSNNKRKASNEAKDKEQAAFKNDTSYDYDEEASFVRVTYYKDATFTNKTTADYRPVKYAKLTPPAPKLSLDAPDTITAESRKGMLKVALFVNPSQAGTNDSQTVKGNMKLCITGANIDPKSAIESTGTAGKPCNSLVYTKTTDTQITWDGVSDQIGVTFTGAKDERIDIALNLINLDAEKPITIKLISGTGDAFKGPFPPDKLVWVRTIEKPKETTSKEK
jgi:hypothetical protein